MICKPSVTFTVNSRVLAMIQFGIVPRPAAAAASTQSLLQLVRMLARSPVASNNIAVYNDLLRLEEDLQSAAQQYHERMEAEESKTVPKTKKHYKQIKEREERKSRT